MTPRPSPHALRRLLTRSGQLAVLALVFLAGGLMLPRVVGATINSGERDAFVPLAPGRVLDTRFGPSPTGVGVKLAAGEGAVIELPVLNQLGVPGSATAVLLNITTANATQPSHLTLWPTGSPRPLASSTNFGPGAVVPNAVTVKVGTGGKISIFNNSGTVDVIADVNGYYDDHNHDDRYYTKAQTDQVAQVAAGTAITQANHVGNVQMANDAVGSAEIINGSIISSDLADEAVTTEIIDDGTVMMADMDTSRPLFNVSINNGTTIGPNACIVRTATSTQFLPAGKPAFAFFESGTIPPTIAIFAATTKEVGGSGQLPFQLCNTSTSATVTFDGSTFQLRTKVIN